MGNYILRAPFPSQPVHLEEAINIPLLSRGFGFRLITWNTLAATPTLPDSSVTSQIITYLDVAEEMCVCVCVFLRVCWPPATTCEKKHHEVDLSLWIRDTGWQLSKTRKAQDTKLNDQSHGKRLALWHWGGKKKKKIGCECCFWDTPHSSPQISLVSWLIMVDLIESCHISAVNGLYVEAGKVKGFLKGRLTHRCCWPPSALPTHTS